MTRDPHRLSDGAAGDELAQALRDAQGDVLSLEAKERVRAGLLATGIGAGPGVRQTLSNGVSSPQVANLLAAPSLKVGLVVLGLAALASAVWLHRREQPSTPPELPVTMGETPKPPARPEPAASPAPVEPPAPPPPLAGAGPQPGLRPAESGSTPLDATPPPSTSAAEDRGASGGKRAPVTMGETPKPPAQPAPRPPTDTSSARAPASRAPSAREGALLLEARRTLDTDPARALALVRAHEKEFPRSQLEPERTSIAAEARARMAK